MVFSSSLFLLYFLPIFFIVYHLLEHKFRNFFLLLTSIGFYAWGAPKFVFTILISVILNYFLVDQVYRSSNKKRKKLFLWLSIILNIGLLAYFKYANFFVDNLNTALTAFGISAFDVLEIGLPIGISFFTFQSMTYTVDIYRDEQKPLKKLSDYIMYILLFPQLIAGPIVRFSAIAHEIVDRKATDTLKNKLFGFIRFTIGLAKKVLIANTLGSFADQAFALPIRDLDTTTAWLGAIAYSMQIYYDFSGYSDMAIGLGKMMGFTFPENFNAPYISKNITEFWRRWHMTLGQWMKDYLYIPLGGNQVSSKYRLYFNLWFVFIISGVWHGANWTFILWGTYHGFFLILDKLFYKKISDRLGLLSLIINFFVVLFGWVLFRSDNLELAGSFLGKMFDLNFVNNALFHNQKYWVTMAVGVFFAVLPFFKRGNQLMDAVFNQAYGKKQFILMSCVSYILLLLCISSITASDFNPFIYFRF